MSSCECKDITSALVAVTTVLGAGLNRNTDRIEAIVGMSPAALDTLQELASALKNNPDILDSKAPKANPEFTGIPIAPTASNETNNTQIATTAFVKNVVGTATGIADNAITSAKIADGAVTSLKLASGAAAGNLGANSIDSAKLADGAIGSTQLANGAVGSTKLAAGAALANLGTNSILQVALLKETKTDVTASTATTTINLNTAYNIISIALSATSTISFSNIPTEPINYKVIINNSGAFTPSFSQVKWAGGTAPTFTSGVGKVDIVSLLAIGGVLYGSYTGGINMY
jgi:hypothetical protein